MLADTAYGSGENIVACAVYDVDLVAPVQDPDAPEEKDRWERPVEAHRPEGEGDIPQDPTEDEADEAPLGLEAFSFNAMYNEVVACPAGVAPRCNEVTESSVPYKATFDGHICAQACPLASRCPTRERRSGDRVLQWRDVKAATATRQRQQRETAFKERYRMRSGVESTAGEFKGRHGAAKLRVRGRERVEATVLLKAVALDVKRAVTYHASRLAQALQPEPAVAMV